MTKPSSQRAATLVVVSFLLTCTTVAIGVRGRHDTTPASISQDRVGVAVERKSRSVGSVANRLNGWDRAAEGRAHDPKSATEVFVRYNLKHAQHGIGRESK